MGPSSRWAVERIATRVPISVVKENEEGTVAAEASLHLRLVAVDPLTTTHTITSFSMAAINSRTTTTITIRVVATIVDIITDITSMVAIRELEVASTIGTIVVMGAEVAGVDLAGIIREVVEAAVTSIIKAITISSEAIKDSSRIRTSIKWVHSAPSTLTRISSNSSKTQATQAIIASMVGSSYKRTHHMVVHLTANNSNSSNNSRPPSNCRPRYQIFKASCNSSIRSRKKPSKSSNKCKKISKASKTSSI